MGYTISLRHRRKSHAYLPLIDVADTYCATHAAVRHGRISITYNCCNKIERDPQIGMQRCKSAQLSTKTLRSCTKPHVVRRFLHLAWLHSNAGLGELKVVHKFEYHHRISSFNAEHHYPESSRHAKWDGMQSRRDWTLWQRRPVGRITNHKLAAKLPTADLCPERQILEKRGSPGAAIVK